MLHMIVDVPLSDPSPLTRIPSCFRCLRGEEHVHVGLLHANLRPMQHYIKDIDLKKKIRYFLIFAAPAT